KRMQANFAEGGKLFATPRPWRAIRYKRLAAPGISARAAIKTRRMPMSVMEMQPGEVGSLSARIYTKVREGLIVGNFAPGDRLLMQDLAEQLGTSVTPVREACLRLV